MEPLTTTRICHIGGKSVDVEMEPAYCYCCGSYFQAFPGVPARPRTTEELEADFMLARGRITSNRVQTCRKRECDTMEQHRQESEFNRIMGMKRKAQHEADKEKEHAKAKYKPKPKPGTHDAGVARGETPLLPDDAGGGGEGQE